MCDDERQGWLSLTFSMTHTTACPINSSSRLMKHGNANLGGGEMPFNMPSFTRVGITAGRVILALQQQAVFTMPGGLSSHGGFDLKTFPWLCRIRVNSPFSADPHRSPSLPPRLSPSLPPRLSASLSPSLPPSLPLPRRCGAEGNRTLVALAGTRVVLVGEERDLLAQRAAGLSV